eukprot:CAMPEP_0178437514 /NCGR_PEP_ID=MMETSP0689_2-20121128/35045_1 /TAXON_ID=160604 /ORGANISM="Amphidinium massartii, Strain CS-259" /LENGTH=38 /DNA_ID= /DNA_START= /DNA_END= /DNA_ORIENTATION=
MEENYYTGSKVIFILTCVPQEVERHAHKSGHDEHGRGQ